jgi:hypothetical protein
MRRILKRGDREMRKLHTEWLHRLNSVPITINGYQKTEQEVKKECKYLVTETDGVGTLRF